MKPLTIRVRTKPRRNPLVLTTRQRQAGPHRDQRHKAIRKAHTNEMRAWLT